MKKRILLAIAPLVSTLFFSAPIAAQDWQAYTSAAGHFSINFPGAATETEQTDTTSEGTPVTIHFVTYSASEIETYTVGWVDMTDGYPEDMPVEQMLENSRDGTAQGLNATILTTVTDTTATPFVEFTFAASDYVGKDRLYLIDKFQYSVMAAFPVGSGITPDADTFIASFTHR
jgi:hypothetical protein